MGKAVPNKTVGSKNRLLRRLPVVLLMVGGVVLLVALQDRVSAYMHQHAFYLSESLLFSSFWWLFVPLLFCQAWWYRTSSNQAWRMYTLMVLVPAFIHLFSYPALVWLLSALILDHTYTYGRTLLYELGQHLPALAIGYTLPLLAYRYFVARRLRVAGAPPASQQEGGSGTLLVNDGVRSVVLAVHEVLYFSANPPYVNVHTESRRYLLSDTLRSLALRLGPAGFVQVHKSTLVQLSQVAGFSSRGNGDYDLTMRNGSIVRLSRNFATGVLGLLRSAPTQVSS
jgi:hypothetical protein